MTQHSNNLKWSTLAYLLSFSFISLFFAFLAIRGLPQKAFWSDEIWALHYAGVVHEPPISIAETLDRLHAQSAHENNPPGYYVLINGWARLVGDSEFALRMLSMLIGLWAVAATGRFALEFALYSGIRRPQQIGLGSAATLAFSSFFIYYAQELRAYSIMVGLMAWVGALYFRLLSRTAPSLFLRIACVVGVALTAYMHFFGLVGLVWLGLFHLLFAPKNRRWLEIVGLFAMGGVLFTPWLGIFISAMIRSTGNVRVVTLSWEALLPLILYAFTTHSVPLFSLVWIVAIHRRFKYIWALLVISGVAILSLVLLNAQTGIVSHVRYALPLCPWLAILTGFGLQQLARGGIALPLTLIVLCGVGVFNVVNPEFNRSLHDVYNGTRMPWKRFQATLQSYGRPADSIFFHSPLAEGPQARELDYYTRTLGYPSTLTESIPGKSEQNDYFNQALVQLNATERVWLGVDQTRPPNFRLVEFTRALKQKYEFCGVTFTESAMRLELYASPLATPKIQFQGGVGLTIDLPRPSLSRLVEVPTHAVSQFQLTAEALLSAPTLNLALHLEDHSGQIVRQLDHPIGNQASRCENYLLDTAGLPAGSYTLLVTIYNWQSGQRLTPSPATRADQRVVVGLITVR
jgi:hypothetical protein